VTSGAKAAAGHAKQQQQQQQAAEQSQGLFTPQQQQQQYLAAPTHEVPSSIMANHGAMQQQYQGNSNSTSHGGSSFHTQTQLQQLQGGGAEGIQQFNSSMVQPPVGADGASLAPLLMPLAGPHMAGPAAHHGAGQQGLEGQLLPTPLQLVGPGAGRYCSGGDGGEGLFAQQAGSSAPWSSVHPGLTGAGDGQWQDGGFEQQAGQAVEEGAAAEAWDVMGGGGAYGASSTAADTSAAGEAQ
jgi:hypothetical protein